jgi:hypothetical protein
VDETIGGEKREEKFTGLLQRPTVQEHTPLFLITIVTLPVAGIGHNKGEAGNLHLVPGSAY